MPDQSRSLKLPSDNLIRFFYPPAYGDKLEKKQLETRNLNTHNRRNFESKWLLNFFFSSSFICFPLFAGWAYWFALSCIGLHSVAFSCIELLTKRPHREAHLLGTHMNNALRVHSYGRLIRRWSLFVNNLRNRIRIANWYSNFIVMYTDSLFAANSRTNHARYSCSLFSSPLIGRCALPAIDDQHQCLSLFSERYSTLEEIVSIYQPNQI